MMLGIYRQKYFEKPAVENQTMLHLQVYKYMKMFPEKKINSLIKNK